MIECSSCQTWVHLTCAKVRRSQIPETWYCRYCRFSSAKSSKGGAKSRARKPELRTKQQSAAALILTKNKRRLWSSSRPLDLWELEDTVSPSLDSQSHPIFSQITFSKRASPAWLRNWYSTNQYKPWTHIRHNNITRLADWYQQTLNLWLLNKLYYKMYISTLYQNKTWNTAVRDGGDLLMAPFLPETYIEIIRSSVMSFIDVLSVVVCEKEGYKVSWECAYFDGKWGWLVSGLHCISPL